MLNLGVATLLQVILLRMTAHIEEDLLFLITLKYTIVLNMILIMLLSDLKGLFLNIVQSQTAQFIMDWDGVFTLPRQLMFIYLIMSYLISLTSESTSILAIILLLMITKSFIFIRETLLEFTW